MSAAVDASGLGAPEAALPAASDGGSTAADGGRSLDADGVSDGAVHVPVFEGAAPFASQSVFPTAKQQMQDEGVNPTKSACLGCHDGTLEAPAWLAGGTVFVDSAASAPAVAAQVRVVDVPTGASFEAHTDADGNFWIAAPTLAVSGPFYIGVRNGQTEVTMPLIQSGLDCNATACHGGAQGPIHLP